MKNNFTNGNEYHTLVLALTWDRGSVNASFNTDYSYATQMCADQM